MSNVIVVGCGRVGSQLASMLSDNGANVCVIDLKADAFANLGRNFNGSTVQGVGFDEDTLVKAGVDECDVMAAVTQSDNANLMCAEVASRLFGVPHVIARLYNPDHERAYMQLGIDYVCGTSLVAEDIFSKVVSGHGAHIDTFGEFEVLRFSLDLSWRELDKRTIRVSEMERDHDVRIIAFERGDGSASSIPTRESILYHGDLLGGETGWRFERPRRPRPATGCEGRKRVMYIVINGGGKIGSYLARVLLQSGNDVAVIEENLQTADRLSVELQGRYLVIHGDGCDSKYQEDAGIRRADVFVATTGQDDDNLVSCEIAQRVLNVPRCIARVNNPKNLRILPNDVGVLASTIPLPENSLIAAVATRDDVQVVNDDTVLFPGDKAVIVADNEVLNEVRLVFKSL